MIKKLTLSLLLLGLLTSCVPSYTPSSRVLVSAAHVGEIEGYTCVYSDEESDVAIYLQDHYKATAPPLDSQVSLANTTGTVISILDSEFMVSVSDISKIVPGVSGTPVTYKGVPIGFISGWNGEGAIRCIFY